MTQHQSPRRFLLNPLIILVPALLLLLSTYYLLQISSSVHHVPLSPEITPYRLRLRRAHLQERLKPEFAITATGERNGPPVLRRTEDFVLRGGDGDVVQGERWKTRGVATVRSLAWRLSENSVEGGKKTKDQANALVLVDGLFPPRPLHVSPNDTLLITVYNDMSESTALHFYGPLQTPSWLDGAVGVTGCPIPPRASMTYNLTVADDGRTGTFWWQAMVGAQRIRGGMGAVVVHAAGDEKGEWEDEVVLMVGDAFDGAGVRGFLDAEEKPEAGEEPMPKGVWINGRGMDDGTEEVVRGLSAQVEGLGLDMEKRHRIRVLNIASGAGGSRVEVEVEGGDMRVLRESSTSTSRITLPVGESTDFILLPSKKPLQLAARLLFPSSITPSPRFSASISLHNSTSLPIPSNSTSLAPRTLAATPSQPAPEPHHFLTLSTSLISGLNSTRFHPSHTGSILTTILNGRLPLPAYSAIHYTSPGATFSTRGESLITAFPKNAALEILIQNSDSVARSWTIFGNGVWMEDAAIGGWLYGDVVRVPAESARKIRVILRRGVHTLRAVDEYSWKRGLGMVLVAGMEEYEVLARGEEVDALSKVMKGCERGQWSKQRWS